MDPSEFKLMWWVGAWVHGWVGVSVDGRVDPADKLAFLSFNLGSFR